VDHAVHLVGGVVVAGGAHRLDAAALVDGHVDDDRALLHAAHQLARDERGGLGAGDEHRADDEVGAAHHRLDVVGVGVERLDGAAEDVLEVVHGLGADVEHGDLRAHAHGDVRGVAADDAAAEDHHAAAAGAGHAAEEHALAAAPAFSRHVAPACTAMRPATSLIGRRERQRAVGELDGLVGHGRGPSSPASLRVSSGSAARWRYV
jgi:hypothetical protein